MLCFLVYNANLRVIGAVDTLPARYLPLVLWQSGTLALDRDARMVAHGYPAAAAEDRPAAAAGKVAYLDPWALWMVRTRDHRLASLYPVVAPLLVAPLYIPANLWLDAHGRDPPRVDRVAELMEKLSASLLASLATVLLFLTLRRDGGPGSIVLALAFAFGTNTWTISSQALWQHGAGELLIAFALLLAVTPATRARMALLGAVCVLMTANRPPDGLIAAAFGAHALLTRRREALWLLVGGIPPLAAMLYYNLVFIGSLAGGYGLVQVPASFYQPIWSGLAGLLISPARGLLVFTPFLIFLPLGFLRRLRSPGSHVLAVTLGMAVTAQILFYAMGDWRAGVSWGPRWLTDILPVFAWMLAPAFGALGPKFRPLFVATMAASVAIQAVGAFWYRGAASDARIFANPGSMRAAWDPRNLPYLVELDQPFARPELQCDANAEITRVNGAALTGAVPLPILRPGAPIEGRARACGDRLPAGLYLLIDGIKVAQTSVFVSDPADRPWWRWRVAARTLGIQPGERILQLAAFVKPSSSFRVVREQRVFVAPPRQKYTTAGAPAAPASDAALRGMAARAASLLRSRQTPQGYWLTAFTGDLRYEAPGQEMNTYLTSVIADLLTPVAGVGTMERPLLDRARRHLAAQIEPDGLVRYHGLPDAPTIGTLGCAITPDSDDTALVWRVAGRSPDDPRWHRAFNVMARYRDARGLYRTWLAPTRQYQCVAPGREANPADLGIQLHIYLTLRSYEPRAAAALCAAMRRAWSDGDVWPYYSQTVLIPYLRAAEARRLGCAVPLPIERVALPVAGQEDWSEAIRLLSDAPAKGEEPARRAALRRLLAQLGGNDFALLRRAPPLIYHNDLSSAAKRFYWSEDFGYALWLRLYDATMRH